MSGSRIGDLDAAPPCDSAGLADGRPPASPPRVIGAERRAGPAGGRRPHRTSATTLRRGTPISGRMASTDAGRAGDVAAALAARGWRAAARPAATVDARPGRRAHTTSPGACSAAARRGGRCRRGRRAPSASSGRCSPHHSTSSPASTRRRPSRRRAPRPRPLAEHAPAGRSAAASPTSARQLEHRRGRVLPLERTGPDVLDGDRRRRRRPPGQQLLGRRRPAARRRARRRPVRRRARGCRWPSRRRAARRSGWRPGRGRRGGRAARPARRASACHRRIVSGPDMAANGTDATRRRDARLGGVTAA